MNKKNKIVFHCKEKKIKMTFLKPTKIEIGSKVSLIRDTKIPNELMRFVTVQNLLNEISNQDILFIAHQINKLFNEKERIFVLKYISSFAKKNLIFIRYYTKLIKTLFQTMNIPLEKQYIDALNDSIKTQLQKENFFTKELIIEVFGKETCEEKLESSLYEYEPNSIIDCLIRDDVDTLQTVFQPNELSNHFLYLPFDKEMHTILECSVIAKATKCFKFLLTQGEQITEDTCEQILEHGTVEMAECCKEFHRYFEIYFKKSITSNNNSISDWILENYGYQEVSLKSCIQNYNISALVYFVEHGSPLNPDKKRNNPLFYSYYDYFLTQYLIDKGCDVFTTDNNQNILLSILSSILPVPIEVIELLITKGLDVNYSDKNGDTPILAASEKNDDALLSYLISKGANVNTVNLKFKTPLHIASRNSIRNVQLLLEKGCNPNVKDANDDSPLDKAFKHHNIDICEYLLSHGAQPKLNGSVTKSFLHYAILSNNFSMVRKCVEEGCDINQVDEEENTPILLASSHGDLEIFKYLIEHNAKLDVKDSHGNSPLHLIISESQPHAFIDYILSVPNIDINETNYDSETPLHVACKNGYDYAVQKLVEMGANLNSYDKDVQTPLFVACKNNKLNIAKMLIESGCNLHNYSSDNSTLIHAICSNCNSIKLLELLISKGANINEYDNDCHMPISIAAEKGDVLMVDRL